MKKLFILLTLSTLGLTFFGGCTTPLARPQGTLLFYVKITDVALKQAPRGDTGVFFYSSVIPAGFVQVYEMRDGAVRTSAGSDANQTAALMRDLAAIDLRPFDFEAEAKQADERKSARLKAAGQDRMVRFDLDGAEFEIGFNGPNGNFVLRKWNPGWLVQDLASDSEDIDKLRRVIDRFAAFYGYSRFEL